jgi:hypothetical protein
MSTATKSHITKQLEVLAIRAMELADQASVDQLRVLEAVDIAYEAALWAGLVKVVGDDIVSDVLSAAFANARRPA